MCWVVWIKFYLCDLVNDYWISGWYKYWVLFFYVYRWNFKILNVDVVLWGSKFELIDVGFGV